MPRPRWHHLRSVQRLAIRNMSIKSKLGWWKLQLFSEKANEKLVVFAFPNFNMHSPSGAWEDKRKGKCLSGNMSWNEDRKFCYLLICLGCCWKKGLSEQLFSFVALRAAARWSTEGSLLSLPLSFVHVVIKRRRMAQGDPPTYASTQYFYVIYRSVRKRSSTESL